MKKRLVLIIGAVVILFVVWWFGTNSKRPTSGIQGKTEGRSASNNPTSGNSLNTLNSSPTRVSESISQKKHLIDPKVAVIQALWAAENTQAQDFYGRAIDQNGQPVEGASVLGTLLWVQGLDVGEKQESHTTQTDQKGEFQFTGFHASRLAVSVTKEGYEMDLRGRAYKGPNAENKTSQTARAVFIMWKLKGAEPMVHIVAHSGLACDGIPTDFDLLTAKKTSIGGGDLAVSLVRNPINIDRGKPFDWTMTLQVAGGGLMVADGPCVNEAPLEGYQSSVTVSVAASAKNWSPSFVQTYYFKARNEGVYGRITINLMANYQPPPTHFELEIYANPSGSRNLEFDAAKTIRVNP